MITLTGSCDQNGQKQLLSDLIMLSQKEKITDYWVLKSEYLLLSSSL